MTPRLLSATLLTLAACTDEPSYREFLAQASASESDRAAFWAAVPFDRIAYSCAPNHLWGEDRGDYAVQLERGGRGTAEGWLPDGRQGSFTGTVRPWEYGRLCVLAEAMQHLGPEATYECGVTHVDTEVIEITGPGGAPVLRVTDDGDVGPTEVWAFKMSLHAVVTGVEWTPVAPGDGTDRDQGR